MPLKNEVNVVTNITNDIAVSANVSIRNPISVRSGGSGSGKGSLERFITFDKHFEHFYFTKDVENFSVVGQVAYARYWRLRTKTTRHGININSWTGHNTGIGFIPEKSKGGFIPEKSKGEKYFRTCSRNSFWTINHDEGYRFEAIDSSEQQPYGVIDNIFKYWFGSECTGYTPNEFLPVFKTWGAAEALERTHKTSFMTGQYPEIDDFRPLLYNGALNNFNFDRAVPGRFYLVPVDPVDPEAIDPINPFDFRIEDDLPGEIESGFLSCGNKRISIKFIKNIELVMKEGTDEKRYWTGKMNAISLFIRGSFRCINNKWYMCYYVMPDVVEKSRY